jgi:hypothetical protein
MALEYVDAMKFLTDYITDYITAFKLIYVNSHH